jgi:hypothetical protein
MIKRRTLEKELENAPHYSFLNRPFGKGVKGPIKSGHHSSMSLMTMGLLGSGTGRVGGSTSILTLIVQSCSVASGVCTCIGLLASLYDPT